MPFVRPQITIYTTRFCSYCVRAKRLLKRKGVEFSEIQIDNHRRLRKEMERLSGRSTVPQIFIEGRHVGGYDDMASLDRQGLLDPMLGLD